MKKKKRNLRKLEFKKTAISKLDSNASKGGAATTNEIECGETIWYTACYGELNCKIYETAADCNPGTR